MEGSKLGIGAPTRSPGRFLAKSRRSTRNHCARLGPTAVIFRFAICMQGDASLRGLVCLTDRGHAVLILPQGANVMLDEIANAPRSGFRIRVTRIAAALEAAVVPFGVLAPSA